MKYSEDFTVMASINSSHLIALKDVFLRVLVLFSLSAIIGNTLVAGGGGGGGLIDGRVTDAD